ncbi:MAG: tRNA pseudouridine(55) synthase TruB [Chloroflexi bacterium]|nr:tRNA pseudouridine(55) synthase TruB [Chloroflexota bacterium]
MARIRRLASQKRVGHAGTLDPLATGVLPILLGRATRLADFIQSDRKTYVAEVQLGAATDTDDSEGAVTDRRPVPPLTHSRLEDMLQHFTGEISQTPPKYSALKLGGRRAYALARAGEDVALSPRTVTIDQLRLLNYADARLTLEVTCSKGTYIRALARDIAACLHTVGHLSALTRTRVGPFGLADALSIENIASRSVAATLLSARCAIPAAPTFDADADAARRFANGQPLPSPTDLRAEAVWVYDPDGHLIGLAAADGHLLRPRLAL